MKKLFATVLSLTLVFSTAMAVSAAPVVSGEVSYGIDEDNDGYEAIINFDGQLQSNLDYHAQLKKDMNTIGTALDPTVTDTPSLNELSFTYKSNLMDVRVGKFDYNPSVMTIMDDSTLEMNAPLAIKVSPKITENLNLSLGYLPKEEGDFQDNSYQVEADYNLGIASVGVNYQKSNDDQDGALVWQVEAQPFEALKLYGEVGKGTQEEDIAKVGALVTMNKFYVRGEYDTEALAGNAEWATRVGYNFTNNLSTELRSWGGNDTDQYNQLRVKYVF